MLHCPQGGGGSCGHADPYLWVTGCEANEVIRLTPEQLGSSGGPTPQFTLMSVPEPVGVAIGSHAVGIPLQP
jgi:hypothetical protein